MTAATWEIIRHPAIRAVLDRLGRAESIAKAATALVDLQDRSDRHLTWRPAFDALAEAVRKS